MLFTEKAKIVDRGFQTCALESTGSKLHHDPYLFSVYSVFLDKFIHFGKNLGGQVKDRSPKKLKSLIEVPYVAHLKVQVPSFNMYLSLLRSVFLDRVIHIRINLGDQGMCRSPKS